MVDSVTSYSAQGLRDWLVQRVTAVVLGLYFLFLLGFWLFCSDIDYSKWTDLFDHSSMKVATLLALLCLMLHAWIGMWTIFTDYVKPVAIRVVLEILVVLALVSFFIWGVLIVWSV